ncbi:hypothetical protein M9H77_26141 [Catharanthus roseus]|uniref:Uncharacterized protein n=1 Tax=Catharanthus roseus TaxID=4058 RepID=A0ACC0ABI0_CATRO|nr:hypothetical protein M9H77_26141 [Catharanthus roseus]
MLLRRKTKKVLGSVTVQSNQALEAVLSVQSEGHLIATISPVAVAKHYILIGAKNEFLDSWFFLEQGVPGQQKASLMQVVSGTIAAKTGPTNLLVSFVYGLHSVVARRPLWNSLTQFGNSVHIPWKLKLLKTPLKALNKKHFGQISTKADLARGELKMVQSSLNYNPQDTTPRKVIRDLQLKTTRLCEAKRKYYAQKAKCNFLLQGDKCSKLFHSLVKRNAKRKLINSLTRDHGSINSSVDEIHSKFLAYYSNFLGTKHDVDDFDAIVIDFGPEVSPLQAKSLIRGGIESFWLGILPISMVKKDFLPLVKRIISIRDKIVKDEGSILNAIGRLSSWHLGGSFETLAYDFFRPMGQRKIWHRVV